MGSYVEVNFGDGKFLIRDGGDRCRRRAATFHTKEPDTVQWISDLRRTDSVWDIGANIGIYSVPMGMKAGMVYAFEPHHANFAELAHNITINGLLNVVPLNLALGAVSKLQKLLVSGDAPGVAFNSIAGLLGEDRMVDPSKIRWVMGAKGTDLIREGIASPTAIKMDVDGIEAIILEDLPLHRCRTAIIECDTNNHMHFRRIMSIMEDAGFRYDEAQATRSRRVEGPNAGVGNIIFSRTLIEPPKTIYDERKAVDDRAP
jgi:FkbM family methyltransferase